MKMSARTLAAAVTVALVGAACLAVIAQEATQAIPDDAEYLTSKLCGMCHKDEKAAFAETAHAKHEPPADTDEPWKHNTGWDKAAGEAKEPGIACEACHGRGSAHAKASKDERKALIVNSMNLEGNNERVSVCAQCHARHKPKEGDPPVDFTPGEDLLAKVDLLPAEEGQAMQQVNELVGSKHFTEKEMGCIQCHTSHAEEMTERNLRKAPPELCVQCHHEQEDMAAHTEDKAKEGDTCVTCHMPNGSHAFAKPPKE